MTLCIRQSAALPAELASIELEARRSRVSWTKPGLPPFLPAMVRNYITLTLTCLVRSSFLHAAFSSNTRGTSGVENHVQKGASAIFGRVPLVPYIFPKLCNMRAYR